MSDPAALSSDGLRVPREEPPRAVTPPPVQIPKARVLAPPRILPTARPLIEVATPTRRVIATATGNCLRTRLQWFGGRHAQRSSFITSAVVHALLLIILGLWSIASSDKPGPIRLVATPTPFGSGSLSRSNEQAKAEIDGPVISSVPMLSSAERFVPLAPSEMPRDSQELDHWDQGGLDLVSSRSWFRSVGEGVQGPLDGRSPDRRTFAFDVGPTDKSEKTVARGLRWLQAHQRPNGSWSFNHQLGPCSGLCRDPGTVSSTTGATALALMPFLSAGHTHRSGEYQEVVRNGLYYLKGRMLQTSQGGDFQEGTMYAQGIAAIVLCEAAAMTGDKSLAETAQQAIDFIVYAQDKNGGGWRYTPGQPGDMTVTGWQLMAIKSGQMSYLRVPSETINRAIKFLDTNQADEGASYGYLGGTAEPTCTAVGLLCRMYTGWRREYPPLVRGVRSLSRLGPSKNDMYFNYYATQVLHHYGGPEWVEWNVPMRESLIASQASDGHESGSWFFEDTHQSGAKGGRLYNTCLAIMTLEVYYRYLPLYGTRAVSAGMKPE